MIPGSRPPTPPRQPSSLRLIPQPGNDPLWHSVPVSGMKPPHTGTHHFLQGVYLSCEYISIYQYISHTPGLLSNIAVSTLFIHWKGSSTKAIYLILNTLWTAHNLDETKFTETQAKVTFCICNTSRFMLKAKREKWSVEWTENVKIPYL